MADAAKKPPSLAQLADAVKAIRRDGMAIADFLDQDAALRRRLIDFAFSDDVPPNVSLQAQREAREEIRRLREQQEHNGGSDNATPDEVNALLDRLNEARARKQGA
jgi:hypothetical protein